MLGLGKLGRMMGFGKKKGSAFRQYQAAKSSRLTADWITSPLSANEEIRGGLKQLRDRSRDLERNDEYFNKYLNTDVVNVVGPKGIQLQAKFSRDVREPDGTTTQELDSEKNAMVEASWLAWGKRGVCTVDKQLSWLGVQKLSRRSLTRDGEIFIHLRNNYRGNDFRFALQMLEADHCDHQHYGVAQNGNRIIMGVEIDADGAPAAYYFSTRHPGENHGGHDRSRIPAEEIVHIFIQTRQGQLRGVPSGHASMLRLQLLKGYEEAEVVAARVGACKQLFYSNPTGQWDEERDELPAFDMEPGTAEMLPPGWKAELMSPTHPTTQFHSFCKSLKQGIASGLNIAYNTWANDLEGVSFSSIRSGVQEERDNWRISQHEMMEILNQPIYEAWLSMALLTQALPLPFSDLDELKGVSWMPRGWSWVDPLKDMKANIVARDNGWKSDQQISAELGAGDLEDNLRQNQQADKLREKYEQSKLTPAESAALLEDNEAEEPAQISGTKKEDAA